MATRQGHISKNGEAMETLVDEAEHSASKLIFLHGGHSDFIRCDGVTSHDII